MGRNLIVALLELFRDIQYFNTLREELATSEKTIAIFQCSENLWRAKCERLRIQLNHAMIDSMCKKASSDPQTTLFTPILTSKPSPSTPYNAETQRFRELLRQDIEKFNPSKKLCTFFLSFTDSSEAVPLCLHMRSVSLWMGDILNVEDRELNQVCERTVLIWDWRGGGGGLNLCDYEQITSKSIINLHNIGAPLIQTKTVLEQNSDECNIRSAYIPVCPLTECFSWSIFTFDHFWIH